MDAPGAERGRGGRKRGRGGRPPKAATLAAAAAAEEGGALPPRSKPQPPAAFKASREPKGEGGLPAAPDPAAAAAVLSAPSRVAALNAPPPPPAQRGPANKQGMLGRGMMGLSTRRGRGSRGGGRGGLGRGAYLAPGALFADAAPSKPRLAGPSNSGLGGGVGEDAVAPNAFRGTFTKDLRVMQYGYGDDELPLQETVDLMEDILLQYISSVVYRAASTASDTLKQRIDERDILFVVRKDPAKFARVKELLLLQQVIRDARISFKQEVAPEVVQEGEGRKGKHARLENAGRGGEEDFEDDE